MEIVRELVLDEPVEEVWAALTEAARLEEWFANDVELDPVPGGEGVFRWDDGEVRYALVDDVDAYRRFAFTWDDGEERTRVAFELEPLPAGTRLVVTETPAAGWGAALELRALAAVHV